MPTSLDRRRAAFSCELLHLIQSMHARCLGVNPQSVHTTQSSLHEQTAKLQAIASCRPRPPVNNLCNAATVGAG